MTAKRGGVVVIGSAHVDLIAVAERIPDSGESLPGTLFTMTPGGKAANQAAQCALLGMKTWLVARTGNDSFGEFLLQALRSKGIDLRFCSIDENGQTGASPIHVGHGGEYASIIVPGAAGGLSSQDLEHARPAFLNASAALIQLELSPALATQAAQIAKSNDCIVVLNASPLSPVLTGLSENVLPYVDWVVLNRRELSAMTSSASSDRHAAMESASLMLDANSLSGVVVTLGSDGVVAVTRNEKLDVPAIPVDTIDTVGAGDAFLGTLTRGIVRGDNLDTALGVAVAAGALATTRHGAFEALPSAGELEIFLSNREVNCQAANRPGNAP